MPMQQNMDIGCFCGRGRGAGCACACDGRGRGCEGFSLYVVCGAPLSTATGAGFGFLLCLFFSFCDSTSSRPSLSARVSIEVRSCMMLFCDCGCVFPSETFAWSLCCQQKTSGIRSGLREPSLPYRSFAAPGAATMARRHGRPEPVTPRQVVSTFLESERARRDSGVLGMNGILV